MNVHRVRKVVGEADYTLGKSTMSLDSGATWPFIDRCRIVLFEKQMDGFPVG